MKRLGWKYGLPLYIFLVFGHKNKVVVAVAKRFESGPIESRVGAFPDVFSTTNSRFKGTQSRSEVRKLVMESPAKSCSLDPMPT